MRELRYIGDASTDLRVKAAWEVYKDTGGGVFAWVNLDTDGGALPGEVSANNDNLTFDDNAAAQPTAHGATETYASDWNVEAAYPYPVFAPGSTIKVRTLNLRKTGAVRPDGDIDGTAPVINVYAAVGTWDTLIFPSGCVWNMYFVGVGVDGLSGDIPTTVNSMVNGAKARQGAYVTMGATTDPPAVADVRDGTAYENGTKEGTLDIAADNPKQVVYI